MKIAWELNQIRKKSEILKLGKINRNNNLVVIKPIPLSGFLHIYIN